MKDNGVFSTPRRQRKITGTEMLESVVNRRHSQRQNILSMKNAKKISESVPDFTAALEATTKEAEEKSKSHITLEHLAYKQGTKALNKLKLNARNRLLKEGTDFVTKKVIGELIFDSYYLDNDIKKQTVGPICESISQTLDFIETTCMESKVVESKFNRLLENVKNIINNTVQEAVERILQEGDIEFDNFNLTDKEECKLNDDLATMGRDEIVELIKDKVVQVVQDERDRGKEKAEIFDEIDQTISDNETDMDELDDTSETDGDEEDTEDDDVEEETAESLVLAVNRGDILLEGANFQTLKIYFNKLRKDASKKVKTANKQYERAEYVDAKANYDSASDIFKDIKARVNDIDDSTLSSTISYFMNFTRLFISLTDTNTTRGGAKVNDLRLSTSESGSVNSIRQFVGGNLIAMIRYCDSQSRKCSQRMNSYKTGKSPYKYNLESVLKESPLGKNYTPNEKYMASLLENGECCYKDMMHDPSWNQFKSTICLLSKKATELIRGNQWTQAIVVIDEISCALSNVGDNITPDVSRFIMEIISMIYGAVPSSEVTISRFTRLNDDGIFVSMDYGLINWGDLLVNAKTNLASVKEYLVSQRDNICENIPDPIAPTTPLEASEILQKKIAYKRNQNMTRGIGGTLFESMMLCNLSSDEIVSMESAGISDMGDTNAAALISSLLDYTVFETLETVGLYDFKSSDIRKVKTAYMTGIKTGKSPVESSTITDFHINR